MELLWDLLYQEWRALVLASKQQCWLPNLVLLVQKV
jgi:hypothetical protein